ncbi:MAG: histidine phosphatase family protein [Bacillota bacterium]
MSKLILDLLRNGGYILYSRHGEATVEEDQPNLDLQNCSTQRNLSELGRRQAIYYGQMIHNLNIPINYPVLASPLCRSVETAQLAFGQTNVQIDNFWFNVYRLSENLPDAEQQKILNTLQSRLEVIPLSGYNKVIIAHGFLKGIGLGEIPNMGTVVIRPRGQGNGYEIVRELSLIDLANFDK